MRPRIPTPSLSEPWSASGTWIVCRLCSEWTPAEVRHGRLPQRNGCDWSVEAALSHTDSGSEPMPCHFLLMQPVNGGHHNVSINVFNFGKVIYMYCQPVWCRENLSLHKDLTYTAMHYFVLSQMVFSFMFFKTELYF